MHIRLTSIRDITFKNVSSFRVFHYQLIVGCLVEFCEKQALSYHWSCDRGSFDEGGSAAYSFQDND